MKWATRLQGNALAAAHLGSQGAYAAAAWTGAKHTSQSSPQAEVDEGAASFQNSISGAARPHAEAAIFWRGAAELFAAVGLAIGSDARS